MDGSATRRGSRWRCGWRNEMRALCKNAWRPRRQRERRGSGMPRWDDDTREALLVATVDVVMETRRLALMGGANPLKLWDQITSRLRAAARTTARPSEWATKFMRDLQLSAPSKELSSAIEALATTVGKQAGAWLDLLDREYGYVVARARLEAERRKEAREMAATEGTPCGARHPELNRTCHRPPHGLDEDHAIVIEG